MAGKVVNADILMDHAGKSKGLGEVQFDDQSDAISAIGIELMSCTLLGDLGVVNSLQLCSMARCYLIDP